MVSVRRWVAVAVPAVAAAWSGGALASTACDAINAGALSLMTSDTVVGVSAAVLDVSFDASDRVTIRYVNVGEAAFSGPGSNPSFLVDFDPGNGSDTVVLKMTDATTGAITSFVRAPFSGGAASISLTCTPANGGGGGGAQLQPDQTANTLLDLSDSNITVVVPGNALSLPGSRLPRPTLDEDEVIDEEVERIADEADKEELERLRALEARGERSLIFTDDDGRVTGISIRDQIRAIERRLAQREARRTGDVEELEDGEAILYAPREHSPVLDIPWPLAYGEEPLAQFPSPIATANTYTDVNGMPVNIWTRVQGAFMDGTYDRSGIAGSGTVGIAAGLSERWDVGAYATVLGGHAEAGAFGAEVDTVGGGIGLYTTYDLPYGGILGLSGLQVWAGNDSDVGGVTGDYGSSFTRLDASVARPFALDGFILTPAASFAYERLENDSFVDSSGTTIPRARDERFVASGSVTASRPIFVGGDWIDRATPRLQVQGSYVAAQSTTPIPATGADLVAAEGFTLDLTGGLDLALAQRGVVSLAGGVAGFAGDVQTYRARVGFKMPLN